MSKSAKNTRNRIVSAAWKLFYANGYEGTTIDDIIEAANVSKGSFYHYFSGKGALISSVSYLFDNTYETLLANIDDDLSPIDKLVTMTRESFFTIENTVPVHLLNRIMSTQLTSRSDSHLLDPDRAYFHIVRKIVIEGKDAGIFKDEHSVNEICQAYALFERGLMYDWCISNGNYSLSQYSSRMMRIFLNGFTL